MRNQEITESLFLISEIQKFPSILAISRVEYSNFFMNIRFLEVIKDEFYFSTVAYRYA